MVVQSRDGKPGDVTASACRECAERVRAPARVTPEPLGQGTGQAAISELLPNRRERRDGGAKP